MAFRKKTTLKTKQATAKKDDVLPVVESNLEDEQEVEQVQTATTDTVTIACHLPFDLRFSDVPDDKGGVKTVTFPGVNSVLRGKSFGVLADAGKAVAVTISKKDWEAIKALHGKERVFTGRNGTMPCLLEMESVAEFKSAVKGNELEDMKHGLEPVNPQAMHVKEKADK